MREITRYILRKLIETMLFVTLALTCVVWLSQSLRFVDLIINRGLSFFTFIYLTLLLLPSFLTILLPIALFCAVAYTYHRLIIDSEFVVLRAAGLSDAALMKPALIMAGFVVMLGYAINFYFQPVGFREFKDRQSTIRADYSGFFLQEGLFNNLGDGLTVYIRERLSNGEILGILFHDNRNRAAPVTMMARRGVLLNSSDGLSLSLFKGSRQEMDRDRGKLSLLYFDRHDVNLSSLIDTEGPRRRNQSERYIHELFGEPRDDNDRSHKNELRAEGHKRLLLPLSSLVMTLIALTALLRGKFSRRNRPARMVIFSIVSISFYGIALELPSVVAKIPLLTPLLYAYVIVGVVTPLYFLLFKNKQKRRSGERRKIAGAGGV